MIIDQFRDYGGYENDIEALKLRARLFAVGAMKAHNIVLARKLFHHSNVFARKAHELERIKNPRMYKIIDKHYTTEDEFALENNQRRLGK
jgi:hypothetical protein